jgi:hypothetical protein
MVNQVIPTIATLFKIRKTLGKTDSEESTTSSLPETEALKVSLPTSISDTSFSTDLSSARRN